MVQDLKKINYHFIQIEINTIKRILIDETIFMEFESYCNMKDSELFRDNKQFDYLYAIHKYLEENREENYDKRRIEEIDRLYKLHLTVLQIIKDEDTFKSFVSKKTSEFLGIDREDIMFLFCHIYRMIEYRDCFYFQQKNKLLCEEDDNYNYYINSELESNRVSCIRIFFKRRSIL